MTKEAIKIADWTLISTKVIRRSPGNPLILCKSLVPEDAMSFEEDTPSKHYVYKTWCKTNKLSPYNLASRINCGRILKVKIIVILKVRCWKIEETWWKLLEVLGLDLFFFPFFPLPKTLKEFGTDIWVFLGCVSPVNTNAVHYLNGTFFTMLHKKFSNRKLCCDKSTAKLKITFSEKK